MSSALLTTPAPPFERTRGIWQLVAWLERGACLLLLLAMAPLLFLAALTIIVLSRRSPLVAHLRVGQFGRPLSTLKFRTMWPSPARGSLGGVKLTEHIVDESGIDYKASYDPRVTSNFARFCRRYSIDELPQLIHVAAGEMSIVGPRPLTGGELTKYYGVDANLILLEKPGITGLWQVSGRSRLTYEQRREMDLFLVKNRSAKLYITILLRTIVVVLRGKDGW